MSTVTFRNVSKRYGAITALDNLDLEIGDGEFVSLLGPSGSGKSTTLNLLAGLISANSGTIHIGEREITHLPPEQRDLAMVFQNYALYPHMTVAENIAFPLEARKPRPDKDVISRSVERVAETLGIGNLLARYPKEISGGQQQRVALGRAMVRDPRVFLLDEPLSNLDARLRVRMRRDLKELHRQLGSTIVYVTHDQSEAMTLSDRVAVFAQGRLQQVAPPREIYDNPVNTFVANFVGDRETNFLDGMLEGNGDLTFRSGPVVLRLGKRQLKNARQKVTLGVRPEAVAIASSATDGMRAEVILTELAGAELFVYLRLASGNEIGMRCDPREVSVVTGETVNVRFDPRQIHLFDQESGQTLA
ncbi:ABC transporter ATP-binding protein [Aquamicrobium sp. LC103]|uniref:ABC transporter ATP-binding protein n=1 Tax=Aquamicrobium sp. LC103 TaxID=1120658 RepID=UPI00063E7B1C|nr:ABC transporter ATP-binding protein [Aquamicrobium sp. LC103]TKT75709.1 ABC transporter ATP-binding protein [Aquamicrobium sp. LC103]